MARLSAAIINTAFIPEAKENLSLRSKNRSVSLGIYFRFQFMEYTKETEVGPIQVYTILMAPGHSRISQSRIPAHFISKGIDRIEKVFIPEIKALTHKRFANQGPGFSENRGV